MATLNAFLRPEKPEDKEILVSDRFKGEDGKPVSFKIRAVTEEESASIRKKATTVRRDRNGQTVREFDAARYARLFVIAGTVEPNFRASDLCEAYGVLDPELAVGKMLLAGEFALLSEAISQLSGISEAALAEAADTAKN